MARLKPDTFEYSGTKSAGEERVFNSLKNALDDSWLVCHSWRWLRHPGNSGTVKKQGEGDFVLFNPACGIIVFEVKGGSIEYREDGKYYSNGILIQNPEQQASHTKFDIKARLKEKGIDNKVYVVHAVWFPDIKWEGEYPANLSSQILFDELDLQNPEVKLRQLFPSYVNAVSDNGLIHVIEKMLSNSFKLVKSLRFKIQDAVQEMVRLTQQQTAVLEYLEDQRLLGVKGRAGTGKTLLAVHLAKLKKKEGKKVVYLCYNRALCNHISDELSSEGIDVFTYHQYAKLYLEKYKPWRIDSAEENHDNYFDYIGSEFSEVISDNQDNYDCCILDEAQDLKPEWFTELKDTFAPNLNFYFFFDPLQIPYSKTISLQESQFDCGIVIIPLYKNMRNTKQVSQAAWNVLEQKYNPLKHFNSIEGDSPEIMLCQNDDSGQTLQKIMLLINIGNIKRERISIITMKGHGKSTVGEEIYDIPVISFRKFKGLENDVVIIADVNYSHFQDPVYQRELYVAISRSRFLSVILIENKETPMKRAFIRKLGVESLTKEVIENHLKRNNYE